MKKFALLVVALGALALGLGNGGCASPAYTGEENVNRMLRAWDFDGKQAVEDASYELMLYPPSRSTIWNLR